MDATLWWLNNHAEPVPYRAKAAGESYPHCQTLFERGDDGTCNHCGKPWPEEKVAKTVKFASHTLGQHNLVIDRPKGFKKTLPTQQGPVEYTYPVDYGYFPHLTNPDDNEGLDVFVGQAGPHYGRFMKGTDLSGEWKPDERKWFARLSDQELAAVKAMYPVSLLKDHQTFTDEESFLQDVLQHGVAGKTEKDAAHQLLSQLHQIKALSDQRNYAAKHKQLQELMRGSPADWEVDQPEKHHPGVTHTTGFRYHTARNMIPPEILSRAQGSVKPSPAEIRKVAGVATSQDSQGAFAGSPAVCYSTLLAMLVQMR